MLEACRELGVVLIAYTPLASGALTGKYRPGQEPPDGMRRMMSAFRKLDRVMPVVAELERIVESTPQSRGS